MGVGFTHCVEASNREKVRGSAGVGVGVTEGKLVDEWSCSEEMQKNLGCIYRTGKVRVPRSERKGPGE